MGRKDETSSAKTEALTYLSTKAENGGCLPLALPSSFKGVDIDRLLFRRYVQKLGRVFVYNSEISVWKRNFLDFREHI